MVKARALGCAQYLQGPGKIAGDEAFDSRAGIRIDLLGAGRQGDGERQEQGPRGAAVYRQSLCGALQTSIPHIAVMRLP